MIVASCPLRISLVGGSTDHPDFLKKYGHGSVISFPSNLRTYVTIHQDVFGSNTIEHNYHINYSRRETVKNVSDIQNELVRHCFQYFNVDRINCSLTSDIYSVGSGLAASSAYLQALIKAIFTMRSEPISDFKICEYAEMIERQINPLVGQQDFYGSIGGLKRIDMFNKIKPTIHYLSDAIFSKMDIYLLFTGVLRSSTDILKTIDIDKSLLMMADVDALENAINSENVKEFSDIMNNSWKTKKETSPYICENATLVQLDNTLANDVRVLSHKLCGAGNGGYFLVFTKRGENLDNAYNMMKPIRISHSGVTQINLNHEFARI